MSVKSPLSSRYLRRMHPEISHFPRHIFYGGNLLDGVNVRNPNYGNPLLQTVCRSVAIFRPFTVLNLDSKEEKTGTSLSNPAEARLAVYLVEQLKTFSRGLSTESRIAVITPYAQQSRLLQQTFADALGPSFEKFIEVNTVDAYQGREGKQMRGRVLHVDAVAIVLTMSFILVIKRTLSYFLLSELRKVKGLVFFRMYVV